MKSIYKLLTCVMLIFSMTLCLLPASKVYAADIITSDTDHFILENANIKVTIRKNSGYISTIFNKKTGITHKSKQAGSWPFKIVLSNNTVAEITHDTRNTVSSSRIYSAGGNRVLEIIYNNLVTNGISAAATGIKAVVRYTLNASDDYFMFDVSLTNNSGVNINRIHLCEGGVLKTGEAQSKMVIPLWGEMAYWDNPSDKFSTTSIANPYRMSYPGTGWNDLEMGFIDISGARGGIGIAYINKQQTVMDFRVASDNGGMSVSPVLLNPEIGNMIVPVKPGEKYSTDYVLIAAHQGDWHRMADIYRKEFQKAFTVNGKPDYLTWQTISSMVKDTDVMLRFFQTKFSQVYDVVKEKINTWKIPPAGRVMVWYTGQNEKGYGHDTPTMIPVNPSLGTIGDLAKLSDDLHAIGANIFHYEHPHAFAVDSSDYPTVSSANPNQSSAIWDGVNHYYLCIDNNLVMNLWKNKLIPDIKKTRPDGLQFDQGSLQFTVCDIPGHNHGLDAVSRLSSHTKAMIALEKYVRTNLNSGKTSYLVSEGFNDLTCRYIDVNQTRWDREQMPVFDGELIFGGRQYVFPQYLNHYNSATKTNSGIWKNMRQYVAIIGGIAALNEGEDYVLDSDTEYIWLKNEMRTQKAPGYPYNYRDNVGLSTNSETLEAKVFTEGNKATITFWAKNQKQTDAVITIDPQKLGLSGRSASFRFDLGKNKIGYIIVDMEKNKVIHTSVSIKNQATTSSSAGVSSIVSSTVSNSGTDSQTENSSGQSIQSQATTSHSSAVPNTSSGTPAIKEKPGELNLLLIVSIVCVLLILVGSTLFVMITEKPGILYNKLFGFLKSRK